MSHEIRTPMNGVIGLTEPAVGHRAGYQPTPLRRGCPSRRRSTPDVINDILDFSKLDAGKVVLDPTDFDPRRLVEDVGALLAPAAFAKHLELVAYCLPDVPATVRATPGGSARSC